MAQSCLSGWRAVCRGQSIPCTRTLAMPHSAVKGLWACWGFHTLAQRSVVMTTDYPAVTCGSLASSAAVQPRPRAPASVSNEASARQVSMTLGRDMQDRMYCCQSCVLLLASIFGQQLLMPIYYPSPPSLLPCRQVLHVCPCHFSKCLNRDSGHLWGYIPWLSAPLSWPPTTQP